MTDRPKDLVYIDDIIGNIDLGGFYECDPSKRHSEAISHAPGTRADEIDLNDPATQALIAYLIPRISVVALELLRTRMQPGSKRLASRRKKPAA